MATKSQINGFIQQIAPILQREAKARGYKVVSPAIAQALQESLSGKSASGLSQLAEKYHNYHGMKCGQYWLSQGRPSVSLKTGEEYKVGVITQITDYFRVFPDMESGLKGYYDFLDMKRYASVKNTKTPEAYLQAIKAVGYCTSSTYVNNCLKKIREYNLTQYDDGATAVIPVPVVKYQIGRNYTLQEDMHVRESPGGKKKKFLRLTTNAKSNGYADGDGNGILKKGTVVTCKGTKVTVDGAVWMMIPSGCICAVGASEKVYIK